MPFDSVSGLSLFGCVDLSGELRHLRKTEWTEYLNPTEYTYKYVHTVSPNDMPSE